MKQLMLVVCTFAILGSSTILRAQNQAQPSNACNGKKVVTTIPHEVLVALNNAARTALKTHDFEPVKDVVDQPGSGLVMSSLCRDAQGKITSYVIANRDGCFVAGGGKQF